MSDFGDKLAAALREKKEEKLKVKNDMIIHIEHIPLM